MAIEAFKVELKWLKVPGAEKIILNGYYGTNAVPVVKAFQESVGRTPDGIVGYNTTKALCRQRILNFEAGIDGMGEPIPDHLLCRLIDLESAYYLACRNTYSYPEIQQNDLDPDGDHGIGQLHKPLETQFANGKLITPDGKWEPVYRIGVNVRVVAEQMRAHRKWLKGYAPVGTTEEDLWRAAVFAHNAPYWAKDWLIAGFPCTGGGEVTVGGNTYEKFEWACLYDRAVHLRNC